MLIDGVLRLALHLGLVWITAETLSSNRLKVNPPSLNELKEF
jgi:hypothetical protein